jgi:hypothetical protein
VSLTVVCRCVQPLEHKDEGKKVPDDQPNPFAPPTPVTDSPAASQAQFDPAAVKKIEAVVKDAGQFWLAILLCIFCSGLGAIIIGPWYFVRLLQWNALAKHQPMLLDPSVPRGSLAQKFQSAKVKLIIGMCFGAVILVLSVLFLISAMASVRQAAN